MNIEDRTATVISDVFGITADEARAGSVTTVANWDSLGLINIAVALEDEFEIQIPDETIATLTSYETVVAVVRERLSAL